MPVTITEAIRNDHKLLRKKLQDVKLEREKLSARLNAVYLELHAMNDVHMHNEERFFYAALKEYESSRDDALESLQEHHLLRILEREMDGLPKSSDEWKAKLGLYIELSNHHFDEEEEKLFGELKENTGIVTQQELGHQFELSEQAAGVGELSATHTSS